MPRLPPVLEPAFPLIKRAHRATTRGVGAVTRRLASQHPGPRAVPQRGTRTSEETAALEPESVVIHPAGTAEVAVRRPPHGDPAGHWVTEQWGSVEFPAPYILEIRGGVVATRNAVHITPGGTLDYATSNYFGVAGWKEHPIYLKPRLPEIQYVEGTVLSLATRGTWANYYHVLLDLLPRWGVFQESLSCARPDFYFMNRNTPYARELLELVGLGDVPTIEPQHNVAVRADRLLVPSLENQHNQAPPHVTRWLREALPPRRRVGRPARIYLTRGRRRNSRRVVNETEVVEVLRRYGFAVFDPGTVSVQEQIDHFACAEVVVAPHGAGLANLSFCPPGVRVLEIFAPRYIDPGHWATTSNIPGSIYRYLVGTGRGPRPGGAMNAVYQDIIVDVRALEVALAELLAADPGPHEVSSPVPADS